MEIQKEWLINRAEKMMQEIEVEINALEISIKNYSKQIETTEKEFEQKIEDIRNKAIEHGLDEKDINNLIDEFYASHIQDSYFNKLSQQMETFKLRVTALTQDKEIYDFYLKNNK